MYVCNIYIHLCLHIFQYLHYTYTSLWSFFSTGICFEHSRSWYDNEWGYSNRASASKNSAGNPDFQVKPPVEESQNGDFYGNVFSVQTWAFLESFTIQKKGISGDNSRLKMEH